MTSGISAQNKAVTISGLTLDGASKANYALSDSGHQTETTASITAREVGLTWSNTQLTYNGEAQKPTAMATGLIGTDTCIVTVTGEQANAGNYTATASSLSNSNYSLPQNNTTTFNISKANITPTNNYNGGEATAGFTISRAANPLTYAETQAVTKVFSTASQTETLSAASNGEGNVTYDITSQKGSSLEEVSYFLLEGTTLTLAANTPAGTYTVTVRATAAGNDNYNRGSKDSIVTVTVEKAAITPTVSINGWTYGENANTPSVIGNTGNGEVTYTYKVKDAQENTYSDSVPANAGTYIVRASIAETPNYAAVTATANFTISKGSINPTVSIENWTYGAEAKTPHVSGNEGNGEVTYTYKVKDAQDSTYTVDVPTAAGEYTVKATIAATGNYAAASDTEDFTIARRPVIVSGITTGNKIYDGNTTATLMYTGVTFGNIKDGDNLTVTATGTFNNNNVGDSKRVTITDLTLGGESVSNYVLATTGQQNGTTANITAREITVSGITAKDKTYDGTKTATLVYNDASYDGIVTGDSLTVNAMGTFADANAGTDKPVTISGLTLGGADAGNYALAVSGQQESTTADITAKEITISGITAKDKIYDRTTIATLDYSAVTFGGIVTGDTLSVTATGTFDTKDVGDGKTVTITGLTLDGESAHNYVLADSGQQTSTTANVTRKEVTVKANDKSKIYGHRDPAYNANVTGMVSGEDSSLIVYNFDRTAGDDVGTYIIKPNGETNQGNYTVRYQTGIDHYQEAPDCDRKE